MICKTGWDFLSPSKHVETEKSTNEDENLSQQIESKLFYPITFPLTTGAGTISVLFTLTHLAALLSHYVKYTLNIQLKWMMFY